MCDAIAKITEDFSFAYLKEAFVATLLELARDEDGSDSDSDEEDDSDDGEDGKDPLDKYEFWRMFKAQVKIEYPHAELLAQIVAPILSELSNSPSYYPLHIMVKNVENLCNELYSTGDSAGLEVEKSAAKR